MKEFVSPEEGSVHSFHSIRADKLLNALSKEEC